MGHIHTHPREYHLLQQRLDRTITGAPASPVFMQILRILFSPAEADLARRIPTRPISLDKLADRLQCDPRALEEKLTDMARRGLVLDLERNGRRYFTLAPVVIGFFEFTFMRSRDQLPLGELARLFDQYMHQDDRFARSVFQGRTQLGRSLVREEAIPEPPPVEVLDWERASHILQTATSVAVSLCPCRHKETHLGTACDRPLETCLSLNMGAEALARRGLAKPISKPAAMELLEKCKEAGLAQTADNVQRGVTYICNCCGCCCGMLQAIRRFDLRHAVVTSNWVATVDAAGCKGCGKCARACPLEAIEIVKQGSGRKARVWAVPDRELCLGCGVCFSACPEGALRLQPRQRRVHTPEHTFDRMLLMAIERGKLTELLFDDPEALNHRALGRFLDLLCKLPPVRAALAIQPLRSTFLQAMLKRGGG